MSSGFEPSHSSLSLSCRLMRVFRPVVQVPMLAVSDPGHHHSFRCAVAAELVSDNDARCAPGRPQELPEETNCGKAITLRLYEDVEDNAVLIDCSPEVMSDTVDLQKHFIQMPLIASSGTSSPEPVGILFAELIAPAPDRFVADEHAAGRHQLF